MPKSSQGFWTEQMLRGQLADAERSEWWPAVRPSAERYDIPVEVVIATMSRETRMRNFVGDSGHGFGPMQVDIRYHPVVDGHDIAHASGAELVAEGCRIWASYRGIIAAQFPAYTIPQVVKVTCSAYNCGTRNAIRGSEKGDSDLFTTGRDYGRDVVARSVAILHLLTGQ